MRRRSKSKILFIPINDNHVRIFGSLMRELRGLDILAIGIDKYKNEQAEKTLREWKIPFKPIQKYKIERAEYIIDAENPDIVIVGNDIDPLTSSFVKAANLAGVPTLLIQDGAISKPTFERLINFSYLQRMIRRLISEKGRGYILKRGIQRAARRIIGRPETKTYWSGECKKIAVWGPFTKRMFVREGVNKERVVITGNPRLDSVFRKKFDKREIYQKLKLNKREKIVVLATSGLVEAGLWTDKEMRTLVQAVSGAIRQFSNLRLVIKPHPRESIQEFWKYLPKDANALVVKDINLYGLINACELLITEVSTVALEAVVFGKPVLILNFTGKSYPTTPYPEAYVRGGVALEVRNADELVKKIRQVLLDSSLRKKLAKNRSKFIREHLFKLDGSSPQRVADLIKWMIKSKNQMSSQI